MSGRGIWAVTAALSWGLWLAGCQSSRDGVSRLPSFGLDSVPSQSEPPVEESEIRTASALSDSDEDEDEPSGRKGLFSRLLPGKNASDHRALPLSSKKSADADEDDE